MKSRLVMHVDMNAFFASVEQKCNPALRGRPVAVVGSSGRTVVTTASYEARSYGVRTGMNRYEAARACPGLIFVVGNNRKYMDASGRIFDVMKRFSPMVEPYSIDEAFVDITGTGSLFGSPRTLATTVKKRIMEETGLACSVGVGPNKLIAKLASGMEKPDGLVVIEERDVAGVLEDLGVGELWGIGPKLTAHLEVLGITTCSELARAPVSVLRARFGIVGERLLLMGRGIDTAPILPDMEGAGGVKSVGHSRTLTRDVSDRPSIERNILKLSEMVGGRLRRHDLKGRTVALTLRYSDFQTFSRRTTLSAPTNDTRTIAAATRAVLSAVRLRSAVRLIGVTVSGLTGRIFQLPLFEEERRREGLLRAMDSINDRFGDSTLTWSSLLDRCPGAEVIPPSWRPEGVKRIEVR